MILNSSFLQSSSPSDSEFLFLAHFIRIDIPLDRSSLALSLSPPLSTVLLFPVLAQFVRLCVYLYLFLSPASQSPVPVFVVLPSFLLLLLLFLHLLVRIVELFILVVL